MSTSCAGPYADLLRDLDRLYGSSQRKPSRVIPAREVRRPVLFTKSFAAPEKKPRSQTEAEKQNGFLERVADGNPTQDDLMKAHAIIDRAIGKAPSAVLHQMDLQLRALELNQEAAKPLVKSHAGPFHLRRARQQLDSLFGKIPGKQFRELDFTLRQLETAAHG